MIINKITNQRLVHNRYKAIVFPMSVLLVFSNLSHRKWEKFGTSDKNAHNVVKRR